MEYKIIEGAADTVQNKLNKLKDVYTTHVISMTSFNIDDDVTWIVILLSLRPLN